MDILQVLEQVMTHYFQAINSIRFQFVFIVILVFGSLNSQFVFAQKNKRNIIIEEHPGIANLNEEALIRLEKLKRIYRQRRNSSSKVFRYESAIEEETAPTISLTFSSDGRFLCVGENNEKKQGPSDSIIGHRMAKKYKKYAMAHLWDLSVGKEVRRLAGHETIKVNSVSFSGDGKLVSTTGFTSKYSRNMPIRIPDIKELSIWDPSNGEKLFHLEDFGTLAKFSQDGKWIFTVGSGHVSGFNLNALEQGKIKPTWRLACKVHSGLAPVFSPEGQFILVSALVPVDFYGRGSTRNEYGIMQLDINTGRILNKIAYKQSSKIECMAFDPTGQVIATADRNIVVIRDVQNFAEIRRFKVGRETELLSFDKTGQFLTAFKRDGKWIKWEIQTGKLQQQGEVVQKGYGKDIFAISPNRRIVACANRDKGQIDLVDYESGVKLVRLHQFHEERSWLVETIDGYFTASKNLLDEGAFVFDELGLEHNPKAVQNVLTTITNINSIQVAEERPPVNKKGRLFVLCVGVSQYKYKEYNLEFAARDAEELVRMLKKQKGAAFDDVVVEVFTDKKATQENLQKGLEWLQRSCTDKDVAIVSFSGHGIRGRNGLYFMTHEGDGEGIQYTCLNWVKVAESIAANKAKGIIFFADCCHAGAFAKQHRATQKDVFEAFQKKKGLFLYCSSRGNQYSLENADKRHGLFTYSILEALQGKADSNHDKNITTGELRKYVDNRVNLLTNGKQTPDVPFPSIYDAGLVLSKINKTPDK
jgi:WD40 repeat protein